MLNSEQYFSCLKIHQLSLHLQDWLLGWCGDAVRGPFLSLFSLLEKGDYPLLNSLFLLLSDGGFQEKWLSIQCTSKGGSTFDWNALEVWVSRRLCLLLSSLTLKTLSWVSPPPTLLHFQSTVFHSLTFELPPYHFRSIHCFQLTGFLFPWGMVGKPTGAQVLLLTLGSEITPGKLRD